MSEANQSSLPAAANTLEARVCQAHDANDDEVGARYDRYVQHAQGHHQAAEELLGA